MHGAFLSGLREASCILRASTCGQNNPRKYIQKPVVPSNDVLGDLFKKPDLAFGNFLFVFDPLTEDARSMGIGSVTLGSSHVSEFSNGDFCKGETENTCLQSFNQPLQLYMILSRGQAREIQLVEGDQNRLSYLLRYLDLKLMGANALGLFGTSLITNISAARRGRGRNRMFSGQ